MTDRSDGPRNDSKVDTRAADSPRGVNFDEQDGTPVGTTRGARLDRENSTPIGARRDATSDRQDGTPLDTDAPRSRRGTSGTRRQERRGTMSIRRQRTGHATDETADAWMYRPGEDEPPRSGYGEQGFGAGEVEDGRWGGGSRGGYGGGLPGGNRETRGGWSAARQYHEMGRGPRSFGPDGWGPSDPTPERKDAGPSSERKGASPAMERSAVPAPERPDATPEPSHDNNPEPAD